MIDRASPPAFHRIGHSQAFDGAKLLQTRSGPIAVAACSDQSARLPALHTGWATAVGTGATATTATIRLASAASFREASHR